MLSRRVVLSRCLYRTPILPVFGPRLTSLHRWLLVKNRTVWPISKNWSGTTCSSMFCKHNSFSNHHRKNKAAFSRIQCGATIHTIPSNMICFQNDLWWFNPNKAKNMYIYLKTATLCAFLSCTAGNVYLFLKCRVLHATTSTCTRFSRHMRQG